MTVPDPAPTATDALTEAAYRGIDWDFVEVFRGEDEPGYPTYRALCDDVTSAVVAAIRGMTVEQQAELLDGMTEHARVERIADGVVVATRVRAVGPWRAEP